MEAVYGRLRSMGEEKIWRDIEHALSHQGMSAITDFFRRAGLNFARSEDAPAWRIQLPLLFHCLACRNREPDSDSETIRPQENMFAANVLEWGVLREDCRGIDYKAHRALWTMAGVPPERSNLCP